MNWCKRMTKIIIIHKCQCGNIWIQIDGFNLVSEDLICSECNRERSKRIEETIEVKAPIYW